MDVLHWERVGDPSGPPLVMVHGFTQTGRSWGDFGALLARGRQLVLLDLPGHGGSGHVLADLPTGGRLIVEAAGQALGGRPFDLLGYSLGARFALHAALASPERVARLVVIGATAGIEDPGAAARRRSADETLADALESDGDVTAFLRRWLAAPMFAGLPFGPSDLAERLRNTATGLASSLRLAGTGTQEPLWERLGRLATPTLALAGHDDPRFVAHALRLAGTMPAAVPAIVPGSRHAAHLHQPRTSARIVGHWLDQAP
ncbi:MAG TPA: alpha/beta fold hydrolase [Acidimicrobiales bacterium]|jgi:2-succinyl-6-hydroxy-2,4-cyclohexadiene-1-carboxylate synthase